MSCNEALTSGVIYSDQNPCHCKIVGPTLGFVTTIVAAVSSQFDSPSMRRLNFLPALCCCLIAISVRSSKRAVNDFHACAWHPRPGK